MINLLVLATFFMLFSYDTESETGLSMDTQQVLSLSGDAQKQAFSLLTPEEKKILWHTKLNLVLSESILYGRKIDISDEKKNLIEEVLEFTNEDFFKFNTPESQRIHEEIAGPWYKKAKNVFPKSEFIEIFSSISKKQFLASRQEELDLDGNPASNKCKCNKSEDYCWFSDCESSECESTYTGCGIAWGSPCDGKCY